ncbi:TPR repeat-containing protein [Terrimicrobium sacchariphilum]|uniref:TPR repeat-containing protein n=2 Tax=Terrimicrobium sacchariphilum TaxID=690879 RepID=A0A146GCU4_TERSA|nr:TPR repeat-containing protein [Terrimicrobium sacchariphilum]
MTWEEIQAELDRVVSGPALIDALLDRDDFWKSDERCVVRAAVYLHEQGKSAESIRVIDAVNRREQPLPPKAKMLLRYLCGDALHDVGDFFGAAEVYGEILKLEPSDIAYGNRGLAYWEMGEFQKALDDYLEAVKWNPLNAIALRGAGEMLIKLDRPAEAACHLEAAVKLDPKYGPAYRALGVAYDNCEEWLKSYQALKHAVEINPEDKASAAGIAKIERLFDLA